MLSLAVLATQAFAQNVTYQQEVAFPSGVSPVLATVYDPVSPATVSDPGSHWLTAASSANQLQYSVFSPTSATSPFQQVNSISVDGTARVAATGYGTNSARLYVYTFLGQIVTYDPGIPGIVSSPLVDAVSQMFSLTVRANGTASLIGTDFSDGKNGIYALNLQTGGATRMLLADGSGLLSSTTLYEHFGADGLLYALDYGNHRIEVLDPNNAFTQVRQFAIQGTVANEQFAMGFDGSIFLGDGEGGGQMYSSTGDLLSTFTLPAGSYTSPFTNGIQSYVDVTPDNHVYVFDTTGAHQYNIVPEPSALALLGVGVLSILRRRRNL